MQDTETLVQDHAEAAHRLLKEADYELGRSNIGLTSEKLWEAASHAIKALCVRRGWQHDEYEHLRDAVKHLTKETGDDSVYVGFRIAYNGQLFVGSLEEDDVDTDRPIVKKLVGKLLAAANQPPAESD